MPDRSNRCSPPAQYPVLDSSPSNYQLRAWGSVPTSLPLLRSAVMVVFDLDAKSVQCHCKCDVVAGGEDQVHPLLLIESFAEGRPGLIRDVGLLVEFVDGVDQRAVERVFGLARLRGFDVGVGESRFLADLHVMRPLINAPARL